MEQCVAFLRGIAPSGRNMTNDRLRGVLERLGYADVRSVLASGNLLFTGSVGDVRAVESRIEDALTADLGLHCRTLVRTADELQALVDADPFAGLTHGPDTYLTVTFVKDPAPSADAVGPVPDPRSRVVGYDHAARAVLAVTVNSDPGAGAGYVAWLESVYGRGITTRSWLTVQRVLRAMPA